MRSVFTDKSVKPNQKDLTLALSDTFNIWQSLTDFTKKQYPEVVEEWHFSSEKFGWSFRLKDKKRVLIYLLPQDQFFKVAFVFGDKATNTILASNIAECIKSQLKAARKYAEGRGIRIEVKDNTIGADIEKLIAIKINH